jgi:hypothetical protein
MHQESGMKINLYYYETMMFSAVYNYAKSVAADCIEENTAMLFSAVYSYVFCCFLLVGINGSASDSGRGLY